MVIKPATLQRVRRLIEVLAILSNTITTSCHMVDCLGPAGPLIIRYEDFFFFAVIVDLNYLVFFKIYLGHPRCKFLKEFCD